MAWYILKNRRHLGPYEMRDFENFAQNGQLSAEDFVIDREDAEAGDLKYQRVRDLFPKFFNAEAKPSNTASSEIASGEVVKKNSLKGDHERPLGSFSEEELEKSVVSRIFSEEVDSLDLMQGRKNSGETNAGGGPRPSRGAEGKFEDFSEIVGLEVERAPFWKNTKLMVSVLLLLTGGLAMAWWGVREYSEVTRFGSASKVNKSSLRPSAVRAEAGKTSLSLPKVQEQPAPRVRSSRRTSPNGQANSPSDEPRVSVPSIESKSIDRKHREAPRPPRPPIGTRSTRERERDEERDFDNEREDDARFVESEVERFEERAFDEVDPSENLLRREEEIERGYEEEGEIDRDQYGEALEDEPYVDELIGGEDRPFED